MKRMGFAGSDAKQLLRWSSECDEDKCAGEGRSWLCDGGYLRHKDDRTIKDKL